MEAEASDDEVAEIAAAFAESGIPVEVQACRESQGAGPFQWELMIAVPTTAFFTALAAEGGKDAYKALKRLVGRIHAARTAAGRTTGGVAVVEEATSTWLLLPPELPDEAWRALSEASLEELPSDPVLRWDPRTRQWRDAWDEL